MARIELSNIGGGGTTLSLTTTGTSGASTLAGSVLNIPVYQGQLTLTTTGTSGAATLSGDILNIPNYATGGNPAGSAGQVQFNSTPAGSFAASANLAWDNTAVQLNINAPASPTGKLNVKGSGALTTVNTILTDSGNIELLKVLDNGSTNIGANFNWDNTNGRLGLGLTSPAQRLHVSGSAIITGSTGTATTLMGRDASGNISAVNLTTTGTSGAATLSGNNLNIPQYSGGGGSPAGATGQIQYNNAGAFGASSNLAWDITNNRLGIGSNAPIDPLSVTGFGGNGIGLYYPGVSTSNGFFKIQNATTANNVCLPLFFAKAFNSLSIGGYSCAFIMDTNEDPSTGAGATTPIAAFMARANNTTVANRPLFDFSNRGPSAAGITNGSKVTIWPNGNTEIADGTSSNSGYRLYVNGNTATHGVRLRAPNANSGTDALIVQNSTPSDLYRIEANGKISYLATNTAAGTTGAQTINRPSGTVNFAAGATALVVTNSLCTTASLVFAEVRTNDATAQIKNVVPAAGSFTINLNAAATAETSVGFFIIN